MTSTRARSTQTPDILLRQRVRWRAVAVDMAATRPLAQGYLSEVAVDGALFESENNLPAGTSLRLLVKMPPAQRDQPARVVEVSCKVRHARIAREVVALRLAFGVFMAGGQELFEAASGIAITGETVAV